MKHTGKNYQIHALGDMGALGRVELHDTLALSGAEVTINTLPEGVSVPFVHAHQNNEEIYIVLRGKGTLFIDGDEIDLKEGDVFRIDPKGERCIKSSTQSALHFICIQAKANSLEGFTATDGIPATSKPSWL